MTGIFCWTYYGCEPLVFGRHILKACRWSYFYGPYACSSCSELSFLVHDHSFVVFFERAGALLWVHRLQFWQHVCSWCPLCWLRAVDILLSSETLCMHLVDCICRSMALAIVWHSLQVAVYVWHCGSSCAHCFRTTDSRICLQCFRLSILGFYAMAGFLVIWTISCCYVAKILSKFAVSVCHFLPLIGSLHSAMFALEWESCWHCLRLIVFWSIYH